MSSMSTSTMVAAGAGLAASAFIAYCVYFDHKRRSHPDFKNKLREKRAEKRRKAAEATSSRGSGGRGGGGGQPLPNFNNPTEMQAFFLQEVQLGEELLAEGDVDNGVEHLCNAITMCGQPQQLLQILQQTLPANVFSLLMQRLPQVGSRLARQAAASDMMGAGDAGNDDGPRIIPDAELE